MLLELISVMLVSTLALISTSIAVRSVIRCLIKGFLIRQKKKLSYGSWLGESLMLDIIFINQFRDDKTYDKAIWVARISLLVSVISWVYIFR